jgi:hypothetical protein
MSQTNEETQLDELENITDEQNLEETQNDESQTDWKARAEQLELEKREALKKAAIAQRLLNKKDKTNNNPNHAVDAEIEEIRFIHKVSTFAEQHNLTKTQAEYIIKHYPNATDAILKDPFVASGLKALARTERVENSTPGAGRATTVNGKTFKDMTREERIENFSKLFN